MKVLVIYAHPNPESFNHAVVEEFTKGLAEAGHEYEVVDLYAEEFDPLINLDDLGQFSGHPLPQDVLNQQASVSSADAMVFVGPIHGWSVPAILKGWIDRVLSHGFAYRLDETGNVEGLLDHEKALFVVTMGFPKEVFRGTGAEDAFKKIYLDLTLKFMGVKSAELVSLYAVDAVGQEGREDYLRQVYQLGREF
jgi:NAD(P)H dehydrogenase (quinone)